MGHPQPQYCAEIVKGMRKVTAGRSQMNNEVRTCRSTVGHYDAIGRALSVCNDTANIAGL